jgi:regulator of replication initiation timing
MSKKSLQDSCNYASVLNKIDQLDKQIGEVVKKLGYLKQTFKSMQEDPEEEICPDEVEADRAAHQVIQEICLESLLDIKPKGDA